MSIVVPPPTSSPNVRPQLTLDRATLRLSSPRGDVVNGTLTLSNHGGAPLEGVATVRVGGDWLRVEPITLRVLPGASEHLAVRADPAALAPGYTLGEVAIVTNGGAATVPVRIGVRAQRSWRALVAAVAVSLLVATLVGVALARVTIPAGPAALPLPTTTGHGHTSGPGVPGLGPALAPSVDRPAALAAIRQALVASNAVWQAALTLPSPAALSTIKTGADLKQTTAEARELAANGEHWEITTRGFRVLSVSVSDDGGSGAGEIVKTERRALYGADHPHTPYQVSDATYHLRYGLVRQGGRWLVDDVAVLDVRPIVPRSPTLSVQGVAARILPVVMRVEADSSAQTDVGTGIVIRSSATTSDVVTNYHVVRSVVENGGTIQLKHWTGATFQGPWTGAVVGKDQGNDLAVIRIERGNLPVAAWGDASALQPGQQVVSIGYAEDLTGGPTVTTGNVSSVLRTSPDDPTGPTFIGHSATINPGNSGGPLADMSGDVVGINRATLAGTQGLFFAIPSTRAARVTAGFTGSNG